MIFFSLNLPHIYPANTYGSYASMTMKMQEEFQNLHWNVPEYQDAAPEAVLIH